MFLIRALACTATGFAGAALVAHLSREHRIHRDTDTLMAEIDAALERVA